MVKTMLKIKENIDISEYRTLLAGLKKNASGFKSQKSELFTVDQIKKFLLEAPDVCYLGKKVRKFFKMHTISKSMHKIIIL